MKENQTSEVSTSGIEVFPEVTISRKESKGSDKILTKKRVGDFIRAAFEDDFKAFLKEEVKEKD